MTPPQLPSRIMSYTDLQIVMRQAGTSVQAGRMIRDLLVVYNNHQNERFHPIPPIEQLQAALDRYFPGTGAISVVKPPAPSAPPVPPQPAVPPGVHIVKDRIGDAERNACVDRLVEAGARGVITQDEFTARHQGALEAQTQAELTILTSDLPEIAKVVTAAPPPPPRYRYRHPVILFPAIGILCLMTAAAHIIPFILLPCAFILLIVIGFALFRRVP